MKGWGGANVQGVKDAADKRKREQQLEAALESSRAGRARVFSALGRGRGRPRGAGAAAADTPPPLPLGGRRLQEPQRFVVDENIRDWRSSDEHARRHARSAPGAPLSEVRRGLLAVGGRTNVLVESGRGTHHGAVADMSGRVKARAGRLAADLLGSATHAVTPDDPEGGLALGQETLLKDKVKAITAATAHIQAVRRGKSMPADEAEALRVAALAATTELLGAIDRDRRAVEGPARDLGKALTALAAPGAVRCGPCAGQCDGACAHGPARIATRANAVAAAEAATLRQQQAKVAAAQSSGLDQTSATQSLESFSK
jgi:hypothetical protein